MRRLLLLFFVYVFFSACGNDTPEGIVPKEKMVSLLTDLHLANGYASMFYDNSDSSKQKSAASYKALYKKYDTDSLGLRRSMSYYIQRPEELELMYKQVELNLTKLDKDERARQDRIQKETLRKIRLEEQTERRKERIDSIRAQMLRGKYDFQLPSYKSPAEKFLKIWKKYPTAKKSVTKKVDTLKTDSLRRDSVLKKEQRKNDLPAKRIR